MAAVGAILKCHHNGTFLRIGEAAGSNPGVPICSIMVFLKRHLTINSWVSFVVGGKFYKKVLKNQLYFWRDFYRNIRYDGINEEMGAYQYGKYYRNCMGF